MSDDNWLYLKAIMTIKEQLNMGDFQMILSYLVAYYSISTNVSWFAQNSKGGLAGDLVRKHEKLGTTFHRRKRCITFLRRLCLRSCLSCWFCSRTVFMLFLSSPTLACSINLSFLVLPSSSWTVSSSTLMFWAQQKMLSVMNQFVYGRNHINTV